MISNRLFSSQSLESQLPNGTENPDRWEITTDKAGWTAGLQVRAKWARSLLCPTCRADRPWEQGREGEVSPDDDQLQRRELRRLEACNLYFLPVRQAGKSSESLGGKTWEMLKESLSYFPGAAITKNHTLGDLNSGNLLSFGSGSPRSRFLRRLL